MTCMAAAGCHVADESGAAMLTHTSMKLKMTMTSTHREINY